MIHNTVLFIAIAALLLSCSSKDSSSVTHPKDYEKYLVVATNEGLNEAIAQKEFWSARLRPDSSGVGDLMPLAQAYEQLFEATGTIQYIYDAELLYKKGMHISANNKDGFARGLAHNYITQHRFKEAYELLKKTYDGVSNTHQTQLMLFDAAMEMGDYDQAYNYLTAVKDANDYNYLIRLSKWSDHRGDLDSAIQFMEEAMKVAEDKASIPLRIWTYSNLGDYYGHAGRVDDAYTYYLKTLQLQPSNSHAKKGIAWILYAQEENTVDAHRMLEAAMQHHDLPDYYLLQQELYEYGGYQAKAEIAKEQFMQAVINSNYGEMYNAYLIPIYAQIAPEKALALAKREVLNRPTPETYHLLAFTQLKNEMNNEALQTIETYVKDRTSEPMALYHSALVYKAHNKNDEVQKIKLELEDASFELGPLLMKEIRAL